MFIGSYFHLKAADDDREHRNLSTEITSRPSHGRGSRGPKLKPPIEIEGDTFKWVGEHARRSGVSQKTLLKMDFDRIKIGGCWYAGEKAIQRAFAAKVKSGARQRRRGR
jgi:hypothetical protein